MNLIEAAMAPGRAGTAVMREVSDRYHHITSPLKIGNVVLKNRLLCPPSTPYFLNGPEKFPSEAMRDYYINMAKNGAGIISVRIIPQLMEGAEGRDAHMLCYDPEDPGVQNYFAQMIEGIHVYGSKACALVQNPPPGDFQKMIESAGTEAKFYQSLGFDVMQVGTRNDQDVTIEVCKEVKKAVPDMLVITELFVRETSITQHPEDMYYNIKVGGTLDEAIEYAKRLEGAADIAMIRVQDYRVSHPTTYNIEKGKPYSIHYAEAIKKSGVKIITAPGGGYQNPDLMEEYIASGKTDMITMARAFMCDWEYGKKIYAGRGEDVVPCILCNRCHFDNKMEGPWYSVCSVNPKLGLPSAVRGIEAPTVSKKVAVIGGGPAGLKAALTAAERGHRVTLYEKDDSLGGLLRHSDYSPYKWAIKDFKDYLIRNIYKAGVDVLLNTTATPEMVKTKDYDTILVAVGSDPAIPEIPGVDAGNVYNIVDAFSKEMLMGRDVVVIGGGEGGADAGVFLAKAGHNVTMLTRKETLFPYLRGHYTQTIIDTYNDMKNFSIITGGRATGISSGEVTYVDREGKKQIIQTDDVVVYAGLKPKKDEALGFYGSAKQFFTVGDCSEIGGDIQKCIRSSFFMASQV